MSSKLIAQKLKLARKFEWITPQNYNQNYNHVSSCISGENTMDFDPLEFLIKEDSKESSGSQLWYRQVSKTSSQETHIGQAWRQPAIHNLFHL